MEENSDKLNQNNIQEITSEMILAAYKESKDVLDSLKQYDMGEKEIISKPLKDFLKEKK